MPSMFGGASDSEDYDPASYIVGQWVGHANIKQVRRGKNIYRIARLGDKVICERVRNHKPELITEDSIPKFVRRLLK